MKSFDTNKDFQEFIDKEKAWMYGRIVEAITEAHEFSYDYADIMDAKISESMSIISMRSDRDEWTTSLKLALQWYEKIEEYEKCATLVKLIKSIESSI